MLAWVLISPNQNITQQFFLHPPAMEKLSKSPQAEKSSNNSNTLHMFNDNIYTDFKTAYKHVLISSYVIQVF